MDSAIWSSLRCGYSAGVNKPQTKTSFASKDPVARLHGKTITHPDTTTIKIVANPHVKSSITTLPLLCRSARSFITRGLQTGGTLLSKAAGLTLTVVTNSARLVDKPPGGKATVISLGTLLSQFRQTHAFDSIPLTPSHPPYPTPVMQAPNPRLQCTGHWKEFTDLNIVKCLNSATGEWHILRTTCKALGLLNCNNAECYKPDQQCDGIYDCHDALDENDCPTDTEAYELPLELYYTLVIILSFGAIFGVSECYRRMHPQVRTDQQETARLSMGQLDEDSGLPTYEEALLAKTTDDAEPPPPAYVQITVPTTEAAEPPPLTYDEAMRQQPDSNDLHECETIV